ncbi:glyoxalase/bleomycin resistance protein/dioxygenase superfamily protein [Pseudomonas duriflava]|uniref:Glyoxalase/bleomycin resistance protein/dioxygenase superfamily protein n=1 Tax=Pseudomonas duriflava TaxID=459528 RepID=A0A562QLA2_9PSED|nr:VOC family protein [Pseudomonas duriflava]TWI57499.1 glyoxalase/bleomycin resistance protein/dioxygenase superfamily protein [Pseudomonas duriflava]
MPSREPTDPLLRRDLLRLVTHSIDEALPFWQGALGFRLLRRVALTPEDALPGGVIPEATALADLGTGEFQILLVERAPAAGSTPFPAERFKPVRLHFKVDDLAGRIARIRAAGFWVDSPRTVALGPRAGWQVVQIDAPDNVILELTQPAPH